MRLPHTHLAPQAIEEKPLYIKKFKKRKKKQG
jgi:hypothetical protein